MPKKPTRVKELFFTKDSYIGVELGKLLVDRAKVASQELLALSLERSSKS